MRKIIATRILAVLLSFIIASPVETVFALTEAPAPAPAGGSDKISLDLKGMDVVEVIQMLAAKGNLNVVLSDEVKGRVTIFLKSVNIMDAFEIILTANKLAYDKRGDIIYVMAQREYEASYGEVYSDKKEVKVFQLKYAKAIEASKALNQLKTKIGKIVVDEGSNTIVAIDSPATIAQIGVAVANIDLPTETRVFELRYSKAADLKPKITEILTKGLGSCQVDERTNKIAVKDLTAKMDEIATVISAFDEKSQQVLIEAKIVQVTLADKYRLGVDWEAVMKKAYTGFKTIALSDSFPLSATELAPGRGQAVVGTLGVSDWTVVIQALKEVGDTNLLSSPRITALNNQEAKILVGTSTPYATNTVTQSSILNTTATNLTFLDIGVKLFVTPTINKDGFVTMKIKPEVSSSSSNYTYGTPATTVPIVTTTQAETSVTVKDGMTIIIGGLIKDERSSTQDKIPGLGDVPFIGQAFNKSVKEVAKQELVVFLTPHIVTGESNYLDFPQTPPIGEKKFTLEDKPTFEMRDKAVMKPGFFKEEKPAVDASAVKGSALINAPENYYKAVRDRIMNQVDFPKGAKGTVRMSFVLSAKGEILSGPDIVSSTNHFLDGNATSAVRAAAPFPSFPPSMGNEERFNIDISS